MNRQEIKISFDAPLLYIDEERRIVKCTMRGTLLLPKNVAKSLGFDTEVKVLKNFNKNV